MVSGSLTVVSEKNGQHRFLNRGHPYFDNSEETKYKPHGVYTSWSSLALRVSMWLYDYSFAQMASAISFVPTAVGSSRLGFMS